MCRGKFCIYYTHNLGSGVSRGFLDFIYYIFFILSPLFFLLISTRYWSDQCADSTVDVGEVANTECSLQGTMHILKTT